MTCCQVYGQLQDLSACVLNFPSVLQIFLKFFRLVQLEPSVGGFHQVPGMDVSD